MLVGRYPFQSPADDDALAAGVVAMLRAMRARGYALPEGLGLTPACTALLRRLLEPDENARIRMEEIMQVRGFLHAHACARLHAHGPLHAAWRLDS
jgi:hypothetical protein